MTDDEGPSCVYCGHLIDVHGVDTTGCSECSCGMEPDYWHDEPGDVA